MSSDDSQTGRSGKVKFFKIDPSGDIKPAGSEEGDERPEGTNTRSSFYNPLPPLGIEDDPAAGSGDSGFIRKQLSRLKSKVDDISKIPDKEPLSQPQVDVLRKYIELKEMEVRDLRDQLQQYQAQMKKMVGQVEEATTAHRELLQKVERLDREKETLRLEMTEAEAKHRAEMEAVREAYESKARASGDVESRLKDIRLEREEWKEKIAADLKRIRLKEKELENKYELLKRDAQALLDSKDKQILDLKKKSDSLELELEASEERVRSGAMILGAIDSKKRRLIETMRLAITLLEDIDKEPGKSLVSPEDKKKAG